MRGRITLGLLAATALLVGACSGGPTATPAAAIVPTSVAPEASQAAAPPSTPVESAAAEATSAPNSLDPCQLLTASEASTLGGASFSSGKESTTSGGAKTCTYSESTSIVMVLVSQAADAATAQADWSQEQAKAQAALEQGVPAGMSLSFNLNDASVTGADRAAVATAQASVSGVTVSISAIYVLKGATFFTFSDLAIGHAAASASALEAQAVATLSRVP